MPHAVAYRVETAPSLQSAGSRPEWLRAWPENGSTNLVEFGSRIALQLNSADDLKEIIDGHPLELARVVTSNVFILQAPDALTAVQEAHRLAALPEVLASYPIMRRQIQAYGPYAPRSNDPFFVPYFEENPKLDAQWPMENRDYDGTRLGLDLNVLAAWPFAMGQGITVAVADSGLEMNHHELTNRLVGAPHFNFGSMTPNGAPIGGDQSDPNREFWTHGTSVAGLIAAEGNNGHGPVGVAPLASLASWVIFTTNYVVEAYPIDETNIFYFTNVVVTLVSDDRLMDMYQFAPDVVSVQNHSWGSGSGKAQDGPTLLEKVGIENAVNLGRHGLGAVMIRAAGNDRGALARADDDGYPNDPEVIAVGAVTRGGRATDYSEAGACVLLAAPGGGGDTVQGLFTLDLLGPERGANAFVMYNPAELSDYRWGVQALIGTSASAPLVSGVAALVLSVNTNLGYRDVQQILALSARHYDMTDPDVVSNGAGFLVSHNVGFGVPDAGHAVWLAGIWSNRPPLTTVSITDSTPLPIPDDGLRVEVTGAGVPPVLASIQCFPSLGPHADQPTSALPLVDIGLATNVPVTNLTNKGALILRGSTGFNTKISNAAKAGAAFAIIYNSTNDSSIDFGLVAGTEYSPIPAVLIGNSKGEAIKSLFQTNNSALARIHLQSADRVFHVNSSLLCEHVGVRVQIDHPVRGDLRITLLSPQETRSLLQRFNDDTNPSPADWTYWSTHDFFESSAGDWTVSVSDESAGATGTVRSVSLIIRGTQITDTDHDGLDDAWEISHFGNLSHGPKEDPDLDGYSNAREQVMGTNPNVVDFPFQLDLSPWQLTGTRRMRLSWPASTNYNYEVWAGTNPALLSLVTNFPGQFPEMDWLISYTNLPRQFFRVRGTPNP